MRWTGTWTTWLDAEEGWRSRGCIDVLDVERCESIAIPASRSGVSGLLLAMPKDTTSIESNAPLDYVFAHEAGGAGRRVHGVLPT